jgi:quercetin dioxygenase-like cupin family protein
MSPLSEWSAVENRVTGDRMLVLHRGRDPEGDVLEIQFDLPPYAAGSPLHRHRHVTERFEVLDGALQMCIDGRWTVLRPGDSVTVRPPQAHCFRNAGDTWTTFITEVRPPGHFERFLRSWHGLANAGRTDALGVPRNLLHLARCLQDADFTFASAPAAPQRMLFGLLVSIGELLGSYAALMDFDIVAAPSQLRAVR